MRMGKTNNIGASSLHPSPNKTKQNKKKGKDTEERNQKVLKGIQPSLLVLSSYPLQNNNHQTEQNKRKEKKKEKEKEKEKETSYHRIEEQIEPIHIQQPQSRHTKEFQAKEEYKRSSYYVCCMCCLWLLWLLCLSVFHDRQKQRKTKKKKNQKIKKKTSKDIQHQKTPKNILNKISF